MYLCSCRKYKKESEYGSEQIYSLRNGGLKRVHPVGFTEEGNEVIEKRWRVKKKIIERRGKMISEVEGYKRTNKLIFELE